MAAADPKAGLEEVLAQLEEATRRAERAEQHAAELEAEKQAQLEEAKRRAETSDEEKEAAERRAERAEREMEALREELLQAKAPLTKQQHDHRLSSSDSDREWDACRSPSAGRADSAAAAEHKRANGLFLK
jgi:hypothetical protein